MTMTKTMFNPLPDDGNHAIDKPKPSVVRFPFGRLIGWLILFTIGGMFVYRLSETGGQVSETACVAAIIVSGLAAAVGVVPVYKVWGRELLSVMLGVFLAGTIRLLIGLGGVVIIIIFTTIDRTKFVGYMALFYVAFLVLDTWLSLWVLRYAAMNNKNQESAVHGNVWDIIVRSQSTRRSGQ